MKPYEKYKDSGIKRLGKIPVGWEIENGKNIYEITTGKLDVNAENETGKYPFFTCSMFPKRIDWYAFDCEALLVAGNGQVGFTQYYNGKFNAYQRTYILRNFKNIEPIYLKYYIESELISDLKPDSVGSVIEFIKLDNLKKFKICIPSQKEQMNIISFLDKKISQIDKAIEDLEFQLDKLETYRREVISKVVTKGLNDNVQMKDSGIDWIGAVPEHWEVRKIKWMFEIVKRIYGKEDRAVLSITQNGIKIKNIDENEGQMAESYAKYQIVNINDFAMNSMDLLTGWVDCSKFEGVTSPDYRVFRFLNNKIQNHKYYNYLFQLCYTNRIFYRFGQGVSNLGRWRLQADQFLNMYLPKAPIKEQQQIANYLDNKTEKINSLKTEITKQIDNLKNYKKIIIRDAVTGKINVSKEE